MKLISLDRILVSLPELKLQRNSNGEEIGVPEEILLSGLTNDSRKVKRGYIFVGLPVSTSSCSSDPERLQDYIEDAICRGATAVIVETKWFRILEHARVPGIAYLTTPNCFKTLSDLSILFYRSHPRCLIAVTGTNGKTSTVSFVRQMLGHLGHRVASLGTLGLQAENVPELDSPVAEFESGNTSLYAPDFHRCVYALAEEYAVACLTFEASSHGLKEYRAHGVKVQIAVFTNLTQDHLDYHQDMEDYFKSKCRLFSDLLIDSGVAFLSNRLTSEQMQIVRDICTRKQVKVWIYGQDRGDLYFKVNKTVADASVVFNLWGNEHSLASDILRRFPVFQIENILVAYGVVASLHLSSMLSTSELTRSLDKLLKELPTFIKCVPGRMEYIGTSLPSLGKVFVDFAHTPDALEIVLRGCRESQNAERDRLIVVFGCGGNRDGTKRCKMGAVAATYASHIVVTDDNPRKEDPGQIRRQILEGLSDFISEASAGRRVKHEVHEIGDRRSAIRFGIDCLQAAADICLVAGKGAEQYQIIGNVRHEFSDKQAVIDLLKEMRQ